MAALCLKNLPGIVGCATKTVPLSKFDACARLYQGTSPIGGACEQSADCVVPAGGESSCLLTVVDGNVTGVCIAHGKSGAACAFEKPCESAFRCDGAKGLCVPASRTGEPCDTTFVDGCIDGLTCLPGGLCGPPPKLGEPCFDACETPLFCSSARVCSAPGTLGAPCSRADAESCAEGFFCDSVSSTCSESLAVGSPCADSFDCASRSCSSAKVCDVADVCSL